MMFDAYIFDLDGTLLDTLPDLVRLTNKVLSDQGWPARSPQEILGYVGDGGWQLLRRAAPAHVTDRAIEQAFSCWEELYPTYGHRDTKPYPGIPQLLAALKSQGTRLGVLSNKFDAAVKEVVEDQFPGVFDQAWGESKMVPRKPNSQGLRRLLREMDVDPRKTAFVGDSVSDIRAARGAGVYAVGVTWGYQPPGDLRTEGADAIIGSAHQLLRVQMPLS